jgi:hypothetical protein
MFSRYLEEVVAIQCLLLGPQSGVAGDYAYLVSGKLASLIPLLHSFILLAALEAFALTLHAPSIVNMATRFVCIAPFVVIGVFLVSNEAYASAFTNRIVTLGPDEMSARRRSARLFAIISVAAGIASFVFLIFVEGMRNAA